MGIRIRSCKVQVDFAKNRLVRPIDRRKKRCCIESRGRAAESFAKNQVPHRYREPAELIRILFEKSSSSYHQRKKEENLNHGDRSVRTSAVRSMLYRPLYRQRIFDSDSDRVLLLGSIEIVMGTSRGRRLNCEESSSVEFS